MSTPQAIVLLTLPVPILATLYWHWKVFSLFRSLGDRVGGIGYSRFALQLQAPQIARQLGDVDVLSVLPDELSAEVGRTRRQARLAIALVPIWGLVFFTMLAFA